MRRRKDPFHDQMHNNYPMPHEYKRTRLDQLKEELERMEELGDEARDIDTRIEAKKREIAKEDARDVKTPPLPDFTARLADFT